MILGIPKHVKEQGKKQKRVETLKKSQTWKKSFGQSRWWCCVKDADGTVLEHHQNAAEQSGEQLRQFRQFGHNNGGIVHRHSFQGQKTQSQNKFAQMQTCDQ